MATKASEDKDIIYFPIDQGEQAKQAKPEYLLARPVYERIAGFLKESLDKTIDSFSSADACLDLDHHRAHNAILLDGGRGTGKSTILVNLSTYASTVPVERTLPNKTDATLADFLLILKPVDPTLLENDDDLFLNIIVAALLRNKEVKDATQDYEKSKTFYTRLQALGTALESAQKQKSEFGMDKLRAFIGNHSVSDEVHQLFYEALKITGKKLIVLPIDDVDTSLQHAFNNLEVVRRYLASPYVVPIISGDLDLFHEVIWRNFFSGLVDKSNEFEYGSAAARAKKLADEYERKLLPVARRIIVPTVKQYLSKSNVFLSFGNNALSIPLIEFVMFLNKINNKSLNGYEGSHIFIKFASIRSLCQLIVACKDEILKLDLLVKQLSAREGFALGMYLQEINFYERSGFLFDLEREFRIKLSHILLNGDYGTSVFLVNNAYLYWNDVGAYSIGRYFRANESIFDTLLFQPLEQENSEFAELCDIHGLKEAWLKYLEIPSDESRWLTDFPDRTLMSYPLPDRGVIFSGYCEPKYREQYIVRSLLIFDKTYHNDGGNFVFLGRLFELLVLSLFKNISQSQINMVFERKPFYSMAAFSGAKSVKLPRYIKKKSRNPKNPFSINDNDSDDGFCYDENDFFKISESLEGLISEWRLEYSRDWDLVPSPLFIYRVMNKFFTQLANCDFKNLDEGYIGYYEGLAKYGLIAVNAFAAAVGSFEVDEYHKISNKNGFSISPDEMHKSDLYRLNIERGRVIDRDGVFKSGFYSAALTRHPFVKIFNEVLSEV